ncbi:putative MFS-type transporter [Neolecta irregularis DAH-3]|uniref:Putative MFS-type transporter n=1 Tax=Neolecta irregularis (strain DAH-3) TaxID=1198029 RepID=A0A1U7LSA5_NEOID|nr:putative MFS-type transporter [Neolecta irregularis DAH-3]|eukprot:OLL25556.1 putative MFS-type transporter [Neolecta irregularis DAH-3]
MILSENIVNTGSPYRAFTANIAFTSKSGRALQINPREDASGTENFLVGSIGEAYARKVGLLNNELERLGFGRYQKFLFILTGFGWFVDNMIIQAVAISLPPIELEFSPKHITMATLSLYVGLTIGATGWGIGADIIGYSKDSSQLIWLYSRKLAFNATLAIGGIFCIAIGGAPNFVGFSALLACVGIGIGGNLPVDGTLFLEFIPSSNQNLLTALSAWWCLGQLVASLVAWPLVGKYTCESAIDCTRIKNIGWRYMYFVLGGLTLSMFICRYVIFHLWESPKWLLSQGRDADAMDVINEVATKNNMESKLVLKDFQQIDEELAINDDGHRIYASAAVKNLRETFHSKHIKALYSTRKLGFSTSLIILLWGLIGLAYPLYNAFLPIYLRNHGSQIGASSIYETYRNFAIISACGVPGSVIASYLVNTRIGRKGVMALSTILTGIFLFLFTYAKTSQAILGFSCATAVTQNVMYGVLYAYTPEVFPAPHRGTGTGLASSFNRICGMIAPLVASFTNIESNTPLFVSASLFLVAGILMGFLPYESRGKASI